MAVSRITGNPGRTLGYAPARRWPQRPLARRPATTGAGHARCLWANSIKADERGTLRALSTSLQLALDHCPLGQPLQPFSAAAGGELTRQQCYYNDLVRLQQAIGCRPAAQQLAEQWLAVSDDLNLEPLHLYPLYQEGVFTEQDLLPWQRSVLNKLAEKRLGKTAA